MDFSWSFWLLNSKQSTLFAKPSPAARDGLEVVVECLREMRRLAEASATSFHVLVHHRLTNGRVRTAPILDDVAWQQFMQHSGAVDITDYILAGDGEDPIGSDGGHWSAAGHRRVASKIIADFLNPPGR